MALPRRAVTLAGMSLDAPRALLAVVPGARRARLVALARRQRHAWEWRRVRRYAPAPGLVVDLGCGVGDWAARLAPLADELVAVDAAPELAAEATRRLAATGHRRWRVACDDVRRFDAFDRAGLVVLGAVLMYLDDDDAIEVLARVRDRLAPGGIVQQREWCAVHLGRPSRGVAGGRFRAHRRPADYVALAHAAGLEVVEQRASPSLHAEQLVHQTIAFGHEGVTRALAPLARAVARAGAAWTRRGTVAWFLRRR